MDRALYACCALAIASTLPWFASCAENEGEDVPKEDASAVVPTPSEAGTDSAIADAGPDATCDASDSNCAKPITCAEAEWCPVTTPVSTLYTLTSVWGSGPNDVWAVGSGGTIMHYDGTKWALTATTPAVRNTFHAVWGTGANDVWAVSMTDVLFHTNGFTGGKAEWTKVTSAQAEPNDQFPRATYAIWGTAAGDVRIGARDRTVFDPKSGGYPTYNQYSKTTEDGGVAWAPSEGAGAVHGFWGSSADDVWYIADNSEKNGWQRAITMHGTRSAAKDGGPLETTWTAFDSQSTALLEAIWGSSKDDVWVVGDMGVIRRMTPGLTRWAIVASGTTQALHAIWGSSAHDVWAVGDFGTILHWNGTSWKASVAALPAGKKKAHLFGVWGSGPKDVWIVGDGITLHSTGAK